MKVKINEEIDFTPFSNNSQNINISDSLFDILKGLLDKDSNNRLSVSNALKMEYFKDESVVGPEFKLSPEYSI